MNESIYEPLISEEALKLIKNLLKTLNSAVIWFHKHKFHHKILEIKIQRESLSADSKWILKKNSAHFGKKYYHKNTDGTALNWKILPRKLFA